MPTSPTTYTFLPVSLNFVCSKYAAAANDDEKISSAGTFNPSESNFFLYPARDLVELLVTNYIFLPSARSLSSVSGIPGITLSPLQITPSQSKINTSTSGSKSLDGSVNLSTFALSLVDESIRLEEEEKYLDAVDRATADDAAGENARAEVAIKTVVRADLRTCMV